jgi:hypothetical protein
MPRIEGFLGPSYESQSPLAAGQQTINWYPEQIQIPDRTQIALYPTPGLSSFATGLASPGRGIFHEDGRVFAVFGTTLYEIASDGTPTSLGTVAEDANPATFSTNGDGGGELFVTSGGNGYIYDLVAGGALTLVVSGATFGDVINGRFVALDAATSTLRMSASLDGTSWNAAHIIQRSSASDPWTAMILSNNEIFLLGSKTGEAFFDAGASPIPFRQSSASVFERGIGAPRSLSRLGDTIAWLGSSEQGAGRVYRLVGYQPVAISDLGVERAIAAIRADVGVGDAEGWSYEKGGHVFYVLSFPAAGVTWVYDVTMQAWHQRLKWNTSAAAWEQYRPVFHAAAFDKNLVCDREGGTIYDLSDTTHTDVGGDAIRRLRRGPHLVNEQMRVFVDLYEIVAEPGLGLTSGQGSDPEMMLRYSNTGGKTWSDIRTAKAGKRGAYSQRLRWLRCGSGRDRMIEVSTSDPIPWRIVDAFWKGRAGAH